MGAGVAWRRAALIALAAVVVCAPRPAAAKVSFVPIPEIITDPNEGNTFGLLGVFLFLDDKDEIKYMFAPDATYNETRGFYPTLRLFGYPSEQRRYSITLGKSTTKDENYELEFTDRSFWDGRAWVSTGFIYERDSTERFFGFGNDSKEDEESNYTGRTVRAVLSPGVWLLPYVNLAYLMRIERFEVQEGQVDSIPFIAVEHPEVVGRGLETGVYFTHRVTLAYDSRDSFDIPTKGAFAQAYVELADRALGSSTSFVKFGVDWRDYIPFRKNANPILALRALADYVTGSGNTPFWEMNSLGGRKTLRAYGGDRFIDFNRVLAGAELRTRVWERKLFGVNAEIEIAPFIETGQVFRHVTDSIINDLHLAYGVGFRGIARPQIVGFVDIGAGSEGIAVFTGVNYPF